GDERFSADAAQHHAAQLGVGVDLVADAVERRVHCRRHGVVGRRPVEDYGSDRAVAAEADFAVAHREKAPAGSRSVRSRSWPSSAMIAPVCSPRSGGGIRTFGPGPLILTGKPRDLNLPSTGCSISTIAPRERA